MTPPDSTNPPRPHSHRVLTYTHICNMVCHFFQSGGGSCLVHNVRFTIQGRDNWAMRNLDPSRLMDYWLD